MRRWLVVYIGGQKWTVYLVSPNSKHLTRDPGEILRGKCDYDTCRIFISWALPDDVRADTLIHEFLHALLYVTGAERVYNCDPDKDEDLVSSLTPALHRLLKDIGFRAPPPPSGRYMQSISGTGAA